MVPAHRQDHNSHELRSTHYQGAYQDSNHNLVANPGLGNQNHNAFGDDSDSEEHHEQENRNNSPEFDVYKDFNNSGVRYATLLNQNKEQNNSEEDLSQTTHPTDQSNRVKANSIDPDKQDPQGYAFTSSAPLSPTTKFRRNSKLGSNLDLKDPKNRWKVGSVVAFVAVACLGTLIYFLVPRQPFISFETPINIRSRDQLGGNNNEDISKTFHASNPTNFSFDAQLSIALDGRGSYLPTLIRNFKVIIDDLGSTPDSVRIGTGQLNRGFTASSSKLTLLDVNLTFKYDARNSSDTLWQNWRKACGNINQSTIRGTITRPSLRLNLIISFNVIGMIGTRADSTQLNNVACPIELPANAPDF